MVPLKFSVGTTNKFYGLSIDSESSEEDYSERSRGNQLQQNVVNDLPNHTVNAKLLQISLNADDSLNKSRLNDKDVSLTRVQKLPGIVPDEEVELKSACSLSAYDATKVKSKLSRENARGGKSRFSGRSREYNRLSGTGRGREMKKNGAGRHNWGSSEKCSENHTESELTFTHESNDISDQQKYNSNSTLELAKLKISLNSGNLDKNKMIDFSAWKMQQATKKVNTLALSSKTSENSVDLIKKLEAAGFTKYVKEQSNDQNGKASTVSLSEEKENRRKKTVNAYEYLYKEQGHVALFPNYRGRRGMRGNRNGRFGGSKQFQYSGRDAPDLKDLRAFPSLDEARIVI